MPRLMAFTACALLSINSFAADTDFFGMIVTLERLADGVKDLHGDFNNGTAITAALEAIDFIKENWPTVLGYAEKLTDLPPSVRGLSAQVDEYMPIIEKSIYGMRGALYFVGGTLLTSSLSSMALVVTYCLNRRYQRSIEP